jgi:hypothetical protein
MAGLVVETGDEPETAGIPFIPGPAQAPVADAGVFAAARGAWVRHSINVHNLSPQQIISRSQSAEFIQKQSLNKNRGANGRRQVGQP